MFKVTSDLRSGMGLTLRLEGRLTAAWVDEFARELGSAMKRSAKVAPAAFSLVPQPGRPA